MDGYGEFHWNDGKMYIGYYKQDKKDGFGIYYWVKPERAYIGFWRDGKQQGIGKYLRIDLIKYGRWHNSERKEWISSKEQAISLLSPNDKIFESLFDLDLEDISKFSIQLI